MATKPLKYTARSCIISFFYIKPQLQIWQILENKSCVISFFYIKPQLFRLTVKEISVVLYPSSTSNHNQRNLVSLLLSLCYILLLHQTTTPNRLLWKEWQLCYILLLHQTTTAPNCLRRRFSCVISFFYIKPQLTVNSLNIHLCCVISFFYIKPQL